jgi:hypothetical protein
MLWWFAIICKLTKKEICQNRRCMAYAWKASETSPQLPFSHFFLPNPCNAT